MKPEDCDLAVKLEHVNPRSGRVLATLGVVRGRAFTAEPGGAVVWHLLRGDVKVRPEAGSRLTDPAGGVHVVTWSSNGLTGGKFIVRTDPAEGPPAA